MMRQNPDKEEKPQWPKIVGIACVVAVMGGLPGLVAVAIYGFLYYYKKSQGKQEDQDLLSPPQNDDRQEQRKQRLRQIVNQGEDQELALAHAKSSGDSPREHQDRHEEELKDLLRAGIIEQDEYNDRLASFRK